MTDLSELVSSTAVDEISVTATALSHTSVMWALKYVFSFPFAVFR